VPKQVDMRHHLLPVNHVLMRLPSVLKVAFDLLEFGR
jgi:hypothetical protein